jgi:hypothetical protein
MIAAGNAQAACRPFPCGGPHGTLVGVTGAHSVTLTVGGNSVTVSRVFTPGNHVGTTQTATMRAQFDGRSTISRSAPEANGGGRNCDINMPRVR